MMRNKWLIILGVLWEVSSSAVTTAVAPNINWESVSKKLSNALMKISRNDKNIDELENILAIYPDAMRQTFLNICICTEEECTPSNGMLIFHIEYKIANEAEILSILDGYAKLKNIDPKLHEQLAPLLSNPTNNAHSPLVDAIQVTNDTIAKCLIANGVDLNIDAPLYYALLFDNVDLAVLLLKNGADVNKSNPLCIAIQKKMNYIAISLINHSNIDINAISDEYGSALDNAIYANNHDLVTLLLEKGATINENSPLNIAITNQMNELIISLIKQNIIDVNRYSQGETLLYRALVGKNNTIARFLIDNGADVNICNPLCPVALMGNEDILELLIEKGANVNTNLPLNIAIQCERNICSRLLIKHGADVNKGNPLRFAVSSGNYEITQLLIENGASINKNDLIPLALKSKNEALVLYLIKKGAELNKEDSLIAAIQNKMNDVAKYLIDSGNININKNLKITSDKAITTFLCLAIKEKNDAIAQLLIENGADINDKNIFYDVVTKERFAIADVLLTKINIEAMEKNIGYILLRYAIEHDNINILTFLLNKPGFVNISAKESYGDLQNTTALYAAIYMKTNESLLKLLLDHADKDTINYVYTKNMQRTVTDNKKQYTFSVIHKNTSLGCLMQNKFYHLAPNFIEKGADPNIPISLVPEISCDSNIIIRNTTPLYIALEQKQYELALLMIKHKANVSVRCSKQIVSNSVSINQMQTPLHLIHQFVTQLFPNANLYDGQYQDELEKICEQFKIDPNDWIKKMILQNPIRENINKLCILIEQEQNEAFKKSLKRILELIGDDGNIFAQKALIDLNIWPKSSELQKDLENKISESAQKNIFTNYKITCPLKTAEDFDKYLEEVAEKAVAEKKAYKTKNYWIHFIDSLVAPNKYGWKLHISTIPSKTKEIAEIVLPFCEKNKISHKILSSMSILLSQYDYAKFPANNQPLLSQRGKHIVIYPTNDEEAEMIVQTLNKQFLEAGFSRKDFTYVHGDFRVGPSGGIYTRFCVFNELYNTTRGIAYIDEDTLKICAQDRNIEWTQYLHPFQEIGLWNREEDITHKTVFEIMNYLKEDYNFELDIF
ncbi:MAG: ankyrin repeat domain-containing protein [Holosporaceae bacterium]|jgi:ankyrin repeat protein|nr:ankyrin repeat domain-containing protein [Holosporaceae bacterium]